MKLRKNAVNNYVTAAISLSQERGASLPRAAWERLSDDEKQEAWEQLRRYNQGIQARWPAKRGLPGTLSTSRASDGNVDVVCARCEGCGFVANSEDGEPWSQWESLPPGSDLAVRMGLVSKVPCLDCVGE